MHNGNSQEMSVILNSRESFAWVSGIFKIKEAIVVKFAFYSQLLLNYKWNTECCDWTLLAEPWKFYYVQMKWSRLNNANARLRCTTTHCVAFQNSIFHCSTRILYLNAIHIYNIYLHIYICSTEEFSGVFNTRSHIKRWVNGTWHFKNIICITIFVFHASHHKLHTYYTICTNLHTYKIYYLISGKCWTDWNSQMR